MVIDCKYASIYRPSSYGSSSGSSSGSVPLLPPPSPSISSSSSSYSPSYSPSYPPPYSTSYQPNYSSSSGSSVINPPPPPPPPSYPYDGPRYSGYPCFIPPIVSSDYSMYPAPYQPLPSASDSSSIWSPPPPFPNYQPAQSSQIYSVINPIDNDRKNWPDSPFPQSPSQDQPASQQSSSPALKETRAVAELSGPSGVTGTIIFKQIVSDSIYRECMFIILFIFLGLQASFN